VRQQLIDAIYAGQPFRTVLRDLGLTSNQVLGLTRTDEEWSTTLEAALTATRRDDMQHGTNAAYLHGCVCSDCRRISRFGWAGTAPSADQPPAVRTHLSPPIQQLFPTCGAGQTLIQVPQSSDRKNSPRVSVIDTRPPAFTSPLAMTESSPPLSSFSFSQ
jgi:hypothetical protein